MGGAGLPVGAGRLRPVRIRELHREHAVLRRLLNLLWPAEVAGPDVRAQMSERERDYHSSNQWGR